MSAHGATLLALALGLGLLTWPSLLPGAEGSVELLEPPAGSNLPSSAAVVFEWNPVAGATSYQIDICQSWGCDGGGLVASETVTVPSHIHALGPGSYTFSVLALDGVTVIDQSESRPFWVDDFCAGTFLTGDFDGDGGTDRLCSSGGLTRVSRSTSAGFEPPVVWLTQELTAPMTGDFDGDGRTDVVEWDLIQGQYFVAISTGQSFETPVFWGDAIAQAPEGPTYTCQYQAVPGTGDFNGDGRTDVTCRKTNGNPRVFVGLSTGTSFSFLIPGQVYCDVADITGTLDFNADGQSDWYCVGLTNGLFRVYPYVDGTLLSPVTAADSSFCAVGSHVLGDFNADGRTDLACPTNGKVSLSTGNAYLYQGAFGGGCIGGQAFAANVDADGATELVCNNDEMDANDITVRDWDGAALGPEETWLGSFCGGEVGAGDFNADGHTDLLCDKVQAAVAGAPAQRADLMVETTGSLGAVTQVVYRPSTEFPNTPGSAVSFPTVPASGVQYVATDLTVDDGQPGGLSTSSYYYSGAKSDRAERRFLGFAYGRVVKPCLETKTACPFTETSYSQDLASVGRPTGVYRFDGTGRLLSAGVYTYTTNGATIPRTALLTRADRYVYGSSGGYRHTYSTHDYDDYGNRTQTISWGDSAVADDELQTDVAYAYNTTDYIVGRTGQVTRSEPGGPALVETQFRYDGAASWQTAPLEGDLTEVSRYLAEEGRYVTRTTVYDSYGNPTSVTDETGRTVTTEYDTTHTLFPVRTTNAASESVDLTWDPVCVAVLGTTDANNQTTTTGYDTLCRPERTDLPLGGWMERFYLDLGDPSLQRTRVETAGAPGAGGTDWSEGSFDGLGRSYRTERRGPAGQGDILAERAYNARGAVKTSTEPYYWGETPRERVYEYDEMDRVVLVVLPGGLTAQTTYEPGSQEQIDPKGTVVITRFDAHGRAVEVERSLGGQPVITESTYDVLGRLVGMEDAVANEWSWVFDSLGRLTDEDDPDAGQWSYTYDDAGRPATQTDAKAQVTNLAYDTAGRLQTKTNTGGTVTYAYGQPRASYLNVGRLTTVTSPADVLEMDYDALGRPVHQKRTLDGQGYEVQRAYDGLSGALSTITYPDNDSVGPMAYDEAGRVSAIPGIVTALTYDGAGRPLSQTNANTTQTQWTYTADRGLLQAIDTTGSQGTIQDLDYVYDDAGLAQSVTSAVAGEGWNYTYDDLYRMDASTNHSSPADDQSFAYDAAGRITSNSRVGAYTYPAAGQPRPHAPDTVAGNALTYDANGNLLSGGGRSYVWTADNLVSQITMGAATTSFAYDGFGSRLKKTTPGGSTSLYPFGDDYEITDSVVTKYIAVEGLGVIAKRVGFGGGAVTHWLHNDRLSSIQAVTDATGAVDHRRSYRPYGETLAEAGSPTESRGWIDQRNDPETGLTYLHARYYDPQLGVFLSPDPIGVAGGMNQYAYAAGSPVNFTDRSGLDLRADIRGSPSCGTITAPCATTVTYGGNGGSGSGNLPGPLGFIVGLIDLLFGSEPTGPYTVPVHRVPGIVYADDPRVTAPVTPPVIPPTTPPPGAGGGAGGSGGTGGGGGGAGGRGPQVPPSTIEGGYFHGAGGKGLLAFGPDGFGFCVQAGIGLGGGGSYTPENRKPQTGLIVSGKIAFNSPVTGGGGLESHASRDVFGTGELTTSVELQGQRPLGPEVGLELTTGEFRVSGSFTAELQAHFAAGVCLSIDF